MAKPKIRKRQKQPDLIEAARAELIELRRKAHFPGVERALAFLEAAQPGSTIPLSELLDSLEIRDGQAAERAKLILFSREMKATG